MRSIAAFVDSPLIAKLARYPLKILPGNTVMPILRGPLKGKKWIAGSQRHACWLGTYEYAFQDLVSQTVKSGSVFYDIGANVGFYSLLASMIIGPGSVYSFEPVPANVAFLRRHLELNHVRNVEIFEMAISDQVGVSRFRTERTRAMGCLDIDGDCDVRTTTLDALIEEHKIEPPGYIKMDVEGGEAKALSGARRCLHEYKPTLFLATHGKQVHEECCHMLTSWGFQLRPIAILSEHRAELLATPLA